MKKLLLSIIIISVMVACRTQQKEITEEKESSQLKNYFQNSTLPAAIMGNITKEGKMEWHAFGPSIWNTKDTISENNIFRIYSMTKAITSVAALQLVEQGYIGLDDSLNELMPEMSSIPILSEDGTLYVSQAPITLRQLLSHTAGFGYSFNSDRLANFKSENWLYQDKPRLFEPGTNWFYGTSTVWVGKIIEKISGENLETYLRMHITGPLKMGDTWFNVPDQLKSKIVSWGTRDSTGFKENPRIPKKPVAVYRGDGGLFSSPKDYLTFLYCLLNDGTYDGVQILKPETIEMMFTDQLPTNMKLNFDLEAERFRDDSDRFGMAWALEKSKDEMTRAEDAAYWGGLANSYYTIDKKNGIAIVYFSQFFPFNDKECYDFYRLFEKKVYREFK
jgi:CubicO group peptidase (beta-lactamase class C family)